jgi:hypothetical protein
MSGKCKRNPCSEEDLLDRWSQGIIFQPPKKIVEMIGHLPFFGFNTETLAGEEAAG